MLAFIVPIKPKANSKDWEKDNKLLERTLKSICNQIDQNFKVYVVHTDKPHVNYNHTNINFIEYPYDYVVGDDIEDYDSYVIQWYSSRKFAEYMLDKGKKITYACKLAKGDGCKYIMAIDSDDLISNRIAGFVNSSDRNECGWVVKKGYMYVEGSLALIRNKFLQNFNGSTYIIRQDLVPVPDFTENKMWDYNFFEAHGYLEQRIIDFQKGKLEYVPFYGTIWVIHKNNTSQASRLLKPFQYKTILKYLIRGQRISKTVRDEFFLYSIK
jgi:hypothetical protein